MNLLCDIVKRKILFIQQAKVELSRVSNVSSFVTKNWMAEKDSHKTKSLNWTLYNKKMTKLSQKSCLAHEKLKFSRGM